VTAQQASVRWQSRQAKLLASTYRKGWRAGVQNYQAQQAPQKQRSPGGKGAKASPPAQPAAKPPPATMARALSPALSSLARMGAQIAVIVPTAAQLAAGGTLAAATLLAVKQYLSASGWLLAAGASVAWAGEQAGYAHAADADGLLLEWELDPRSDHCEDCPALAALPPMPLALWPTLPGEGMTECNVGCRCSLRAVAVPVPTLDGTQHELLARVGNRQPVLVAA
jgi:hypothetical protein